MVWIILIGVVILLFFIFVKRKNLKLDAITMINGGVKCGKTTLAVALAIKKYKSNLLKWKIQKFLLKIFRSKKVVEKPLLYSNIPLKVPYVPLTTDVISRQTRCAYKSVVLISEMSLVIDSMSYEDAVINERITLFIKLFGHATRGGSCFVETQALGDNHYSVKRCLNRYLWIHSLNKLIPFFLVFKVREMALSDTSIVNNTFNEDIEESTKLLFIRKKVWKKFDTYCYSSFTDNLPVETEVIRNQKKLKVEKIVSFREYYTLPNDKVLIPLKIRKEKK